MARNENVGCVVSRSCLGLERWYLSFGLEDCCLVNIAAGVTGRASLRSKVKGQGHWGGIREGGIASR